MNRSVVNAVSVIGKMGGAEWHFPDDKKMGKAVTGLESESVTAHEVSNTIKQGLDSKTLQKSLSELENKQDALEDAIETEKAKLALANNDYGIKHYFEMYAKADFEDDETRRLIFEYFIDKIYVFEDKLIVDMFYSENHVEVSLDAFLASEEYAKESIKDLKFNKGSVFDKNAAGSTAKNRPLYAVCFFEFDMRGVERQGRVLLFFVKNSTNLTLMI